MKIVFDVRNAQRNFALAVTSMGRLTGFKPEQIVRAEVGTILKTCAARTEVASQEAATKGGRLRALRGLGLTGLRSGNAGNVTVNAGIKGAFGRVFARRHPCAGFVRTHDNNFQPLGRTTAALDAIVAAARVATVAGAKAAKASAGLARQSWVLIADSLGIRLESVPGGNISSGAISKARGAVARGNKQVLNGTSKQDETPGKFSITLINRLPYGTRIGLDRMLAVTVAGRVSFMQNALARGFRGSLQETAKLFKGWTVGGN